MINTSCSLLHVPYTLNNETKLDKDYTKLFAFAEEKLGELEEIKTLSELDSYETNQTFVKNLALFENRKNCYDSKVAKRVSQITEDKYIAFNREKIKECVKLQEEIDLDVLVHGEYERNDMVEYFGQKLNGYLFTEKAWVQSYGTRCVKPPIIWGDVSRPEAMTVDWSVYAQSLTF